MSDYSRLEYCSNADGDDDRKDEESSGKQQDSGGSEAVSLFHDLAMQRQRLRG